MHDFRCKNAEDMYFDQMAEKTRYFKETSEGASYMCEIVENRVNKKAFETKHEIAMKLLTFGSDSHEVIAKCTGLTIEEIKELAKKIKSANA